MQRTMFEEPPANKPHDTSLPLFRPEALATQEKLFGQIMLICPLSFTFWGWFVTGIALIGLGLSFFDTYAPINGIYGILSGPQTIDTPQSLGSNFLLYVVTADPQAATLHPGKQVMLQCSTFPNSSTPITATLLGVFNTTESQAALLSRDVQGKVLKIAPVFPSKAAASIFASKLLQSCPHAEVELITPVGQRRLIRWLFERSGSQGHS